jgi:hypothetical protein
MPRWCSTPARSYPPAVTDGRVPAAPGSRLRAVPPRPATPVVADLAHALLDDLEPLTARLVDAILAEDPSYSGPPVEDLRASCRSNLEHVLRTVIGDDDPVTALAAPRATGDRRARQGVPLESVLHAYRLGFRCIWESMVERARGRDGLEALAEGATDVWEVVDLFSSTVADAYRRAEQELVRRDAGRRDALVDALLDGRGAEPGVLAEAVAALDLPAAGRYAVAVVAAPPGGGAAALAAGGLRAVWRARADSEVALVRLDDGSPAGVVGALQAAGLRAGVSPAVDGLAEVDAGLRAALTALATVPPGAAEAAALDDRLPAALLASAPELADRLVRTVLGEVLALDRGERDLLLDTVAAWLAAGGSAQRAAERLYCHRNTVLNRLRRVEALTGRSPERPEDVVELSLAVRALGLRAGTPARDGALS